MSGGVAIGSVLAGVVVPVVIKILVYLGITVVVYEGLQYGLAQLKQVAIDNLGAMSGDVISMMGACKIDVYISMVFSAVLLKWTIKGVVGGAFKTFRLS